MGAGEANLTSSIPPSTTRRAAVSLSPATPTTSSSSSSLRAEAGRGPNGANDICQSALFAVSHVPRIPFFDSFLRCFSLRFSFSDFPTFLTLCWFGDLSATVTPPVGNLIVGDVEIADCERPSSGPQDLEGQLPYMDPHRRPKSVPTATISARRPDSWKNCSEIPL
jgi:hypothetical protein